MKATKLYSAIDLHSNKLFVAIVDAQGRRIKHGRLFCELHEIEKFLRPYQSRIVAIAVESTFNWYWLVDGLEDLGYRVLLAKPAELTQYDGLKHADDQSDAFFLAELLRLGILPTGYVCERKLRAVRDLLRRRAGLVAKRTALILSLRNLQLRTKGYALDSSLLKSGSAHDLVSQFEDPAEKLTADVQKTHIDGFTRSILRIENHVLKIASKRPHYPQLLSVPGIGKILAMTILLEVAEISRFPSPEDFASYCRTVAAIKTSNGKKKADNNRKCGNRYLAWAFIEAANIIRRYDERAKRWHARKLAKSNHVIATKALACKLAKASWHILSKGTLYDGDRLFGMAKAGPPAAPANPLGEHLLARQRG
jgi:transposase